MRLLSGTALCAALCSVCPGSAQQTAKLVSAHRAAASLLGGLTNGGQEAACRPGDIEIGRQETADEIIVYCSRVSCGEISKRVQQDIEAQKRLLQSTAENNAELQQWTGKNEAAQQAALKQANDALFQTLQTFAAAEVDTKLARLQDDWSSRGAEGAVPLDKVRSLRSATAAWSAVSDNLKPSLAPDMSAADKWAALQSWADTASRQSAALNAAWTAALTNPQLRPIIEHASLEPAFDRLKQGLQPVLAGSFAMDIFLASYGYDAKTWQANRLDIMQRASQGGASAVTMCKLDRLMKIDVRNMNVCSKRLPDPNAPDPEEIRCNPAP
jgi:hypothetical protein